LWLVGSPDFLGKWKAEENGGKGGMQMKWTEGHYWIAEIPYSKINGPGTDASERFEFKFVVKFNDAWICKYQIIRWESGDNNHIYDGKHVQKFLKDDYTKNFIMDKVLDKK